MLFKKYILKLFIFFVKPTFF